MYQAVAGELPAESLIGKDQIEDVAREIVAPFRRTVKLKTSIT